MDQAAIYGKIMDMVTEGMEKVHKNYMTEMEKTEPDKLPQVAKDYAMAMMSLATVMSSLGLLKPYTPLGIGCAS